MERSKRIGRLASLVAALAASTSLADAAASSGGIDGAGIVRGEGRVKPEGSREWHETTTADILTAGTLVEASAQQPLEMTLPDGVTITLEPGARAAWMPAAKLPSEINRWTRGYHLVLEQGELDVRMPIAQKGAHAFLVSTQAGTLTDWRGQLHVRVDHDATAAAIYEGALVVGSNGQGFAVYDGAGIVMRRGINPDKTRVIPAPPQWQAPQSGLSLTALTTDEADAGVDFAWGPVPKATSYRFELATDRTMVRVIDRVTTAEARYRPARPIAPGRYWAHVRAVGDAGIVGAWSTALSVSILRYRLPPGAFVSADGTVVLPEGAGVVVPNGDCCEMAYENTSSLSERLAVPLYWSSVVGPLHLSEDAPMRVVHLRDRATMAEGRLVLAHRALRADVALGPPSARWPIDPIDAHIEIKDPSGRIDVTTEAVDVETTLDLTPLSVAWERRGATWAGRIAPRRIADPSVVRVVVRDALGSEIGRGFLELEPVPTAP